MAGVTAEELAATDIARYRVLIERLKASAFAHSETVLMLPMRVRPSPNPDASPAGLVKSSIVTAVESSGRSNATSAGTGPARSGTSVPARCTAIG